jgi:hypothetical protein
MHLWLQQGPLYCCCLRLLLFPRRAVPALPQWLMTGKSPFSEPRLRRIVRWQEVGGLLPACMLRQKLECPRRA